jgi:hypothetical protein
MVHTNIRVPQKLLNSSSVERIRNSCPKVIRVYISIDYNKSSINYRFVWNRLLLKRKVTLA